MNCNKTPAGTPPLPLYFNVFEREQNGGKGGIVDERRGVQGVRDAEAGGSNPLAPTSVSPVFYIPYLSTYPLTYPLRRILAGRSGLFGLFTHVPTTPDGDPR